MKFCSLASGSSGNCIYVGTEHTHLLVDAGISVKRILCGLQTIDVSPEEIQAVLITHEHTDHISGLGALSRKLHVPIYATAGTWDAIRKIHSLGQIDPDLEMPVVADAPFEIGDIEVNPFSTDHDAANPVCYSLFCDGHKVSIATDLGCVSDYLVSELQNSEVLMLEANHDRNMLEVGPYPYSLKRRILSDHGHLSNDTTGQLLVRLFNDKLRYVILAHLSKENNYPELARETVIYELSQADAEFGRTCTIEVASRDVPSAPVLL